MYGVVFRVPLEAHGKILQTASAEFVQRVVGLFPGEKDILTKAWIALTAGDDLLRKLKDSQFYAVGIQDFDIKEGRVGSYCRLAVEIKGFQLGRGRFLGLRGDFNFEHSHFAKPEGEGFFVPAFAADFSDGSFHVIRD